MVTITVATCAYSDDRWDDLALAMESIAGQTMAPIEAILVVDNNDRLLERARARFPDVRVEANRRERGASGARNTACELARGDVIAFLDDDARASSTWLQELVRPFDDPRVVGVGGRAVPDWPGSRPTWLPEEFDWVVGCSYRGLPLAAAEVRNLIGTNMSVRRDIMLDVGGFTEGFGNVAGDEAGTAFAPRLSTGEETEFCIRVRQRHPELTWIYLPAAVVTHRVPTYRTTFRYFVSRCRIEGMGKEQLTRLAGSSPALASERSYVAKTLPEGMWREVAGAVRGWELAPLTRAATIVIGLLVTGAAYVGSWLRQGRRDAFGVRPVHASDDSAG